MRIAAAAAGLAAATLLACGSPSSEPRTSGLAIRLDDGADIQVAADATSQIVFSALGANGRTVAWSAEGLPAFAQLTGDVLVATPARADAGTYDVRITASAGEETDSKLIHLVVVALDRAPDLVGPPRFRFSDPVADRAVGSLDSCMLNPTLHVFLLDPDGDDARVEVEVVPSGVPHSGVPTDIGAWTPMSPYGVVSTLELASFVPGVPMDVAARATDARGVSSPWIPVVGAPGMMCVPIGLRVPPLDVRSGETRSFELEVLGTDGAPFTVAAEQLPSFATLAGATLTVAAPAVTSTQTYGVVLSLSSGSYTYRTEYQFLYVEP